MAVTARTPTAATNINTPTETATSTPTDTPTETSTSTPIDTPNTPTNTPASTPTTVPPTETPTETLVPPTSTTAATATETTTPITVFANDFGFTIVASGSPYSGSVAEFTTGPAPLTFSIVQQPANGTLLLDPATGAFTHTLDP